MCDYAIFLCCFNNNRIYCLEYTCLIFSIIIFPINLLGILVIDWSLVHIFCEILYSINITISIFDIFLISLVIYSTKKRKITINEYYKIYTFLSILAICIFIYLFISYSYCSLHIFKNYIKAFKNTNYYLKNSLDKKHINLVLLKKTSWIFLLISIFIPIIFSFINILIWISIYYRISFRIYCSFNKEIRKELREQRKKNKQFKELQENITNNDKDKNKDKKINQKNAISVIIEKDRHPKINSGIYKNSINNVEISNCQNKMKINNKIINSNNGEFNQSYFVSSERNFEKSNNQLKP